MWQMTGECSCVVVDPGGQATSQKQQGVGGVADERHGEEGAQLHMHVLISFPCDGRCLPSHGLHVLPHHGTAWVMLYRRHTALVPVYLAAKYRRYGVHLEARSVLAIHNLKHQVRYSGTAVAVQQYMGMAVHTVMCSWSTAAVQCL